MGIRIAYLSDQYWPCISGVSVSIDSFKDALAEKGNEVHLLTTDYPGAKEYDEKSGKINIHRFKSHKVFFNDENWLVNSSEKPGIFRVLESIKPDIIHIQTEFIMYRIALKYARKKKIPIIMTAHTNWEQLIHLYIKFMPGWFAKIYCRLRLRLTFNNVDYIIVPTSLMEVLLQSYSVYKPITVIPTGITETDFEGAYLNKKKNRLAVIKEYPSLRGKRILFFLGRVGMEKNITLLIDVLGNILKKRADVSLVIAGDGPARPDLVKYAADKGLGDNVIFTGYITRSRVKEYYSASDIFVFASMVESQGMVVLEAMSCGVPVVAIGKMGTREVMGGDFGGFMVDDDPEQFEEKVMLLLENNSLYNEKSKEALNHAANWGMSPLADKMLKIYKSLISRKNISGH